MKTQTSKSADGLAAIRKLGVLNMQVCVPSEWSDEQVKEFAERKYPCGTSHGWQIRREGDKALAGASERVQCASLPTNVHIMLDA